LDVLWIGIWYLYDSVLQVSGFERFAEFQDKEYVWFQGLKYPHAEGCLAQ